MSKFARKAKRKRWLQERKQARKRLKARERLVEGFREVGERQSAPR